MRRFIILLTLFIGVFPVLGWTAGTCTVSSPVSISPLVPTQVQTIDCTASADDGSFPSTTITTTKVLGRYLVQVSTNPGAGAAAPTAAYDITLTDSDGLDNALGLLVDRSATATERVSIANSTVAYPIVLGNYTLAITNNIVHSATVQVKLIYVAQ